MYASLELAREAQCELHRQAEAQRPYRQLRAARRINRQIARSARRAR